MSPVIEALSTAATSGTSPSLGAIFQQTQLTSVEPDTPSVIFDAGVKFQEPITYSPSGTFEPNLGGTETSSTARSIDSTTTTSRRFALSVAELADLFGIDDPTLQPPIPNPAVSLANPTPAAPASLATLLTPTLKSSPLSEVSEVLIAATAPALLSPSSVDVTALPTIAPVISQNPPAALTTRNSPATLPSAPALGSSTAQPVLPTVTAPAVTVPTTAVPSAPTAATPAAATPVILETSATIPAARSATPPTSNASAQGQLTARSTALPVAAVTPAVLDAAVAPPSLPPPLPAPVSAATVATSSPPAQAAAVTRAVANNFLIDYAAQARQTITRNPTYAEAVAGFYASAATFRAQHDDADPSMVTKTVQPVYAITSLQRQMESEQLWRFAGQIERRVTVNARRHAS